jgi:hypothetical protein
MFPQKCREGRRRHGGVNKSEAYRGFTIFWQEPPPGGAYLTANVASADPKLNVRMLDHGVEVITGRTRKEMIAKAKQYIDELLAPRRFLYGFAVAGRRLIRRLLRAYGKGNAEPSQCEDRSRKNPPLRDRRSRP